ncbi:MAG: 50S ribosomal protein L14 [Thermoplasmata archaeon]|jgi:large subunit ribosomal protein L14
MKGLAGKQTRGLPRGARLECIDNTGAKVIEIISIINGHGHHRRYPVGRLADIVVCSVKKGTPNLRKQIVKAIIVRQKRPFKRADGTIVQFEDNAAVLATDTGETKGTEIKGPVAKEAAERWPKIAATASIIL